MRTAALLSATALGAALLLTGCAAAAPGSAEAPAAGGAPAAGEAPAADQGTATLELPDRSFSFDIALCMIQEDGVLIEGPGTDDATGELAHLSLDFVTEGMTTGEVRIEIGTDQAMTTTDDFLTAFIGSGDDYGIMNDSGLYTVDGQFHSADGSSKTAGTLEVRCK